MDRLQNKVAVITEGDSDIGMATAKKFVDEGATVIFTSRNQESLKRADEVLGNHAYGVHWDPTDENAGYPVVQFIKDNFSGIDVLFIHTVAGGLAHFEQMTHETFDLAMSAIVRGPYFMIQTLLPLMNEGGSIILTTSMYSHMGATGASVYAASKGALLTLAKNLSFELYPRRIRVNAVSLGPVEAQLDWRNEKPISKQKLAQKSGNLLGQVAIDRFAGLEAIAKTALFFASDDSVFIIGAELIVDGSISALR